MSTSRRMSLRTYIGLALTLACLVMSIISIFTSIAAGKGLAALAGIVASIALIGLLITTKMYFESEDMCQWPAVFMTMYIASTLLLAFSSNWSYALMILPMIAMILLITALKYLGVLGIAAGALMIVLTFVIGIISYGSSTVAETAAHYVGEDRISSLYLASLFLRPTFLMGVACICFFCTFPQKQLTGSTVPEAAPEYDSNNGFM